jgi:hypothetical protein
MAAPTKYPDWALQTEAESTGELNKLEIPAELQATGYKKGQGLSRPFFNQQFYLIGAWIRHLQSSLNEAVLNPSQALVSTLKPVGTVHITTSDEDPSTTFGVGTWQQISGYLAGQDDNVDEFSVAGSTFGSATSYPSAIWEHFVYPAGTGSGGSTSSEPFIRAFNAQSILPPSTVVYIWERIE